MNAYPGTCSLIIETSLINKVQTILSTVYEALNNFGQNARQYNTNIKVIS